MRPKSIIWFERLNLLALATVVPGDYLVWDELSGAAGRAGQNALTSILIVQGVIIAFELLLILMVSRGRSRVFKWIYVVIVGLATVGTVLVVTDELQSRPLYAIVLVVQAALPRPILLLHLPRQEHITISARSRFRQRPSRAATRTAP